LTSCTDGRYGRFLAGYGSNLQWSFWLVSAANTAQWQVWQLFSKLQKRKVERSEGNSKRIEITMRITCHTCHVSSVFGLGTPFGAIATCHRTCHGLAVAGRMQHGRAATPRPGFPHREACRALPLSQQGGFEPRHEEGREPHQDRLEQALDALEGGAECVGTRDSPQGRLFFWPHSH
jgi:hypothetical protein